MPGLLRIPPRCFNPRLREGGDDVLVDPYAGATAGFQSTPPRGRRPSGGRAAGAHGRFNPRLREGGDTPVNLGDRAHVVSIHASAREATGNPLILYRLEHVSIHASAREATQRAGNRIVLPVCFNPRLREGGDKKRWGLSPGSGVCFNPRLREGGDKTCCWIMVVSLCFNPRLREGGDALIVAAPRVAFSVSIHASAREATLLQSWNRRARMFQSTPPRGRRPISDLNSRSVM